MVKIIWTQRSLNDLKSIAEYISKDSANYASLTLERIIDVTKYIENEKDFITRIIINSPRLIRDNG